MLGLVVVVWFCAGLCAAINKTGQNYNGQYKINEYYGARGREFYFLSSLLDDGLTVVRWSEGVDFIPPSGPYYKVIVNESVVRSFTAKNDGTNQGLFKRVAGIPFTNSFQNLELLNSVFSAPEGLIAYLYSPSGLAAEKQRKVIALSNQSGCAVPADGSSLPTDDCQLKDLSLKVASSQIYILKSRPSSIPPDLVKDYLIVADTKNHCIRLLNLTSETVLTLAGRCGSNDFKDGPLGVNMLDSPTSLGVDEGGNIWIYDSGNRYVRMLKLDPTVDKWWEKGLLFTMLKGSCMPKPTQIPTIFTSPASRYSICYTSWIKTSGEPSKHIFNLTRLDQYCTDLFTKCTQFKGVHPLYMGIEEYYKRLNSST